MNVTLFVCALLFGQADSNTSQRDPDAEQDVAKVQFERWQKYYRTVAAEYDMESVKEPPTRLKLQPEPVFTYANPAGGGQSHGAMFVWTRDGRPEILGAIWSRQPDDLRAIQQRSIVHSLHSLSLEPLSATRNASLFWSPTAAGIEPLLISEAPEPVESPQLRITQMRNMARDFTASTVRGKVERQLQFRPQPVYRFEKPTIDRDGAIFVWFEDWDPELLMLIETRATPHGPRWYANFARFTGLPVAAKHKDKKVWSFDETPAEDNRGGLHSRYISIHRVDVLPAIRAE